MKKVVGIFYLLLVFTFFCSCSDDALITVPMSNSSGDQMVLVIDDYNFIVNLEDNETAKFFKSVLPLELMMSEEDSCKKYHYLDIPIQSDNPTNYTTFYAGEIICVSANIVVLFYKDAKVSLSCVKIGRITDVTDLVKALGTSDVSIQFEKN